VTAAARKHPHTTHCLENVHRVVRAHIQNAILVQSDARGLHEIVLATGVVQNLSLARENLNGIIAAVANIQPPLGVHHHGQRTVKHAYSNRPQVHPRAVKHLNSVVLPVADHHAPILSDSHTLRAVKLPRPFPLVTEVEEKLPGLLEDAHTVVAAVRHCQPTVPGDAPHRATERGYTGHALGVLEGVA